MGIRIVTDSTSDLPKNLADKYNIKVVPLRVNFKEKSYLDGIELKTEDFYKKLVSSEELPTTSQVSPGEFVEVFNNILETGDEIIGIFLANEFSGTFSSAKIAKDMISTDKIYLVDSRGVTAMVSLLVIEATKMIENKFTAPEIVEKLKIMAANIKSVFIVDTLKYLVKGGRLSKTQGFAGSMLNLKPIISINEGVITTVHKTRGRTKGINWVMDWIKEGNYNLSNKTVFIVNSDDAEFAERMEQSLVKNFEVGEIIHTQIGSVVGTHSGPGCSGVIFCN